MQNLTKKIVIALFLGIAIGLGLNSLLPVRLDPIDTYFFTPLGEIFLRLIQMLVVPIVFVSLVIGTASLGDPKKLGRIGGKTILFFLTSTAIAITIAMSLALLIKPGEKGLIDTTGVDYEPSEAPSVVDTLLNIIPTNPIAAMVNGEMLQIIFFAVLLGIGLATLNKKTDLIKKFLDQAFDLVMYVVNIVMYTAPFGAFGLIASAVGGAGWCY